MARVEIDGDRLTVEIESAEPLWALRSRLDIPLEHVTAATADADVVRDWKGWQAPGNYVPGVVASGTFHRDGQRVFWDVHDPARAVVITLADERFASLVVEVADPAATVAAVEQALDGRGA